MAPSFRVVRDGLVVGVIAYVAVAAFYAIFDVLAARGSLYTLDLLGKAVFRGLRDPSVLETPMQPDARRWRRTTRCIWYCRWQSESS